MPDSDYRAAPPQQSAPEQAPTGQSSQQAPTGQSSPQQAPTEQSSPAPSTQTTPSPAQAQPSGWVGWITFAAMMMLLVGIFHIFQGLIAIFSRGYYLVGDNGLTVHFDYTGWGWIHLIYGVVVVLAGVSLLAGQMWARVVAVVLAFVSAIVNIGFLAAYPLWSILMVAIDVLVIWALTVHGSEMRTMREMGSMNRMQTRTG
jgi:hypothetical protein